jgi:dihydroorotase
MSPKSLLLKNARVIDPFSKTDAFGSVLVKEGEVSFFPQGQELPKASEAIDLKGKWLVPGLIDMHVHLREPGEEYKETIISGAQAAVAGGFTAIACMPNTTPPTDNQQAVKLILQKATQAAAKIYPVGTISKGLKGEEIAEFGEMREAGAVAFSDDGRPVSNSQLMRRAMEYALNYRAVLISHSEELSLCRKGAMNEGSWSTRLGLRGIPRAAEAIAVYRDLALADYTKCPLHLAHISTKESVSLIRRAKKKGWPVTAETAPHYFSLTEEAIGHYNTYAKMNPPLRTQEDLDAIKEGLQDGTIDVIATDHAPHSDLEKILEFDMAANGIIGLETSVSLTLNLVRENIISATKMVELLSMNPAKILGVGGGKLFEGGDADITVIDPERTYNYSREKVVSKSKNSPFFGWNFTGKAVMTIVAGRIVFKDL